MYIDSKIRFLFVQLFLIPFLLTAQQNEIASINQLIGIGEYENAFSQITQIDTSKYSLESKLEYSLLLGEIYLNMGRNDQALETLKKIENQLPSKKSLIAAKSFEDLGIIYWNNGNKATALSYHERALKIKQDSLPPNDVRIADSYNNIGLIYLESEYLQAIIFFNKALDIYLKKLGDRDAKVALVYSNLAFANSAQGNHADAIRYLDATEKIWSEKYAGDHPNKAYTLSNKGLIYLEQQDYQQAQVFIAQALKMYQNLYGKKHPEIANSYFLLGNVAMKRSEFKKAVSSYQESIYANLLDQKYSSIYDQPKIEGFLNADILLSSLQAKAKAFEALHFEKSLRPKDLMAALESYKYADLIVSKIRQLRKNEADKLQLSKIANDLYENAIRIALILAENTLNKNEYYKEAFRYCERSKSAILLEAIAETNAKEFAGIPNEIVRKEDSIKTQINYLEQKLAEGKGDINELKTRLFDFEQIYRRLIEQVEKDFPKYYDLKFNSSVVTAEAVQSQLSDNEMLISYFIGKENIFAFLFTPKKLNVHIIELPENFNGLVTGYKNAIKYRVDNVYKEQAVALYNLLIPDLKSKTRITIIPAGVLSTIPFEALNSPTTGEPLIKNISIAYDYSTTLWANRSRANTSENSGILLNAPVSFEKNDMKMVNLPATEKEIKEIKYLFTGTNDQPTVLLKDDASETAFKSTLNNNYKYLHFATHGIVNESKPQLSRIFLKPDGEQDGSLFSGEIYNLNMNVSLVTLSACETGLGKVEKGEGVMGLSRALMYAGAQNLIVSLWKVSDNSTAELMISFYGDIAHKTTLPDFTSSLRKAKLKLLNSEQYNDPYFWAPFILVGK